MAMNRRNVLIGLGAVAVGGGAAFGSGAFSQVEAKRNVDITLAADNAALLQLEPGTGATGIVNSGNTNSDSGTVSNIQFANSQLNGDAKTVFNRALKVTNTGNEDVEFYVDDSPTGVGDPSQSGTVLEFEEGGTSTEITLSSTSGNAVLLPANGGSTEVDVIVDLTGSDDADQLPSSVTLVAK